LTFSSVELFFTLFQDSDSIQECSEQSDLQATSNERLPSLSFTRDEGLGTLRSRQENNNILMANFSKSFFLSSNDANNQTLFFNLFIRAEHNHSKEQNNFCRIQ